jgi:hypothetical protein
MAHFEKTPDGYTINHADQTLILTAEEAYSLLCEIYEHSDELWQAIHPEMDISQVTTEFLRIPGRAYREKPEAVKAWERAKPAVEAWQRGHPYVSAEQEEANKPPTVRYLELRLYETDWWRYNELKRIMPTIHMEYEGPKAETGAPVRVYRVRADTLSQDAIRLLNETPLDWKFTDVLVPTMLDEEESE